MIIKTEAEKWATTDVIVCIMECYEESKEMMPRIIATIKQCLPLRFTRSNILIAYPMSGGPNVNKATLTYHTKQCCKYII